MMSLFPRPMVLAITLTLGAPPLNSPTLNSPPLADPTLRMGMALSFGDDAPQAGIGLRLFTDDQQDSLVGSVGVDDMLGSQSWRAKAGVACLGSNSYLGLDMGMNLNEGGLDFGVGASAAQTQAKPDGQPHAPTARGSAQVNTATASDPRRIGDGAIACAVANPLPGPGGTADLGA